MVQCCDICGKKLNKLFCPYEERWTCSTCNSEDILHCENGCCVMVKTFDAGYDGDKEQAKKYLKINEKYEVKSMEVGSWSSYITLKDFPKIEFNSCFFERIS